MLKRRQKDLIGFIDPTAIISSFYDKENKTIYVTDEFYKTGTQLDEVYTAIQRMGLTKSVIWFDSAEPRTIDFFKRKGLNAKPCIKGQNSVYAMEYSLPKSRRQRRKYLQRYPK